jgi:hypothetical protein
VTAWAGLTVNHAQTRFYGKSSNNFNQKHNVIIDTTKDSLDKQFVNKDTVWSILKFVGVQTEVSIMF